MNPKAITLKPRQSEKAYQQSVDLNRYVFDVPMNVNKQMIAEAVSKQFNVTVEDVRVIRLKGKAKRTVRKNARPVAGRQSDVKKAYVRIKAGETIPIFQAAEEKPNAKKDK